MDASGEPPHRFGPHSDHIFFHLQYLPIHTGTRTRQLLQHYLPSIFTNHVKTNRQLATLTAILNVCQNTQITAICNNRNHAILDKRLQATSITLLQYYFNMNFKTYES
jgi:hypothetical protein